MQAIKKISCAVAVAGLLAVGSANAATLDLTTWIQNPSYDGWVSNVSSNWAELGGTASISSNVAGVTSFDWFFQANDYLPFDDTSYYIAGSFGVLSNVSAVGDWGNSGWNTFTFGSPYTGYLEIGIYNVGDDGYSSHLYITNVSAVPEPETYAMLLAGLGLLGFSVRRRKSV